MNISERIIEDILTSDKSILSEILSLNTGDLSIIARQKDLASGRLDLLYLYQNDLLLIELKVVDFYDAIISQINNYYLDIKELQKHNKLIDANVHRIILVTGCRAEDTHKCKDESIRLIIYKPEYVLSKFYDNFKELSYFMTIQSGDYGVVRLGLINSTLKLLALGHSIDDLAYMENRSIKTIRNRLSVASLMGLVAKHKGKYFLTDFGSTFVESGYTIDGVLSDQQSEYLSRFVRDNPFYSSITYTILAVLETVFVLSKNIYPVPFHLVIDYFVKSVGKSHTWKTDKARRTATYIFVNYACEIEYLSVIENNMYMTPQGIKAILLLQLNRSIKLIESQK